VVDGIVKRLSKAFNLPQIDMHVTTAAKGLLYGAVTIEHIDGSVQDLSQLEIV